ncbi:MAG TPA: radical SAM protein [Chitinispirillaceae bacterium]|nr:radical SAM protein [Chitinispirillaceae bacterium]
MTTSKHPCYDPEAGVSHGRVHLPVARGCNIQCNYCNRLYDCVNESRPGVTSAILSPQQAVYYLGKVQSLLDVPVSVAGIAGPGDPFAKGMDTIETLRLVKKHFPEMLLCVATNGLGLPEYVKLLADIGVNHVTVTINAVDHEITAKIISWARFKNRVYRGLDAGKLLLERQLESVIALKAHGITVKINSIIVPGINEVHIPVVAQKMAELGADVMNCLPLNPVEGTAFESIGKPDHEMMQKVRWEVSSHMKVVRHCQMCRADAAGRLGAQNSTLISDLLRTTAKMPLNPLENRPYVAVASREGMLINEHLGKAELFYVFKTEDGTFPLVEVRKAPLSGNGIHRWNELAELLKDCHSLLVNQAGEPPKAVLSEAGLKVIITEGLIDLALQTMEEGHEPVPVVCVKSCNGGGCKGGGQGCG